MKISSLREPVVAPRRRDEAKALFRGAILDAAEAVFAEKSFHGSRMQDIAARARIAVGTLYNHFDDKEDILHALLEERTLELVREVGARPRPVAADAASFARQLRDVVVRVLAFVEAHRAFYVVAAEHGLVGAPSSGGRTALGRPVRARERARSAFRRLVEQGVACGALRGDAAELAAFFGATIRAFTLDPAAPVGSIATRADRIVALFLHGASGGESTDGTRRRRTS